MNNQETLGQRIREARKKMGMRGEDLGAAVGLTKSYVSLIENDQIKGGPAAETVVAIAEALGDETILFAYLRTNPVYRSVVPKIFPELGDLRCDPSTIFTRLAREMEEGHQACEILAKIFSGPSYSRLEGFVEVVRAQMGQVVEVGRGVEILELQLVTSRIISEEERQEIFRQVQKNSPFGPEPGKF